MHRASFLIDRRGMHVLYYSLFFPYSMYCAEIWGNSYSTSSTCVLLQEIAIMCGAIRMDYTNTLFLTSTLLNYRYREIEDCHYRLMYNKSSAYMNRIIQPDVIV